MDESSGGTPQSVSRKISRREFIVGTGITTAATVITGASGIAWLFDSSPEPIQKKLQATRTSMEQHHQETSFIPEGRFTPEFFQKVRESVFDLYFLSQDQKTLFGGTGWCSNKIGNYLYFPTCSHVLTRTDTHPVSDIAKFSINRPFIDQEPLGLSNLQINLIKKPKDHSQDIGIIRAEATLQTLASINPLPYVENYEPRAGEKALVVGFPRDFQNSTDVKKDLVSAQVVRFVDHHNFLQTNWFLNGLANHGLSGAPVVVPDAKGNPQVVGMVPSGERLNHIYPDNPMIFAPISYLNLLTHQLNVAHPASPANY